MDEVFRKARALLGGAADASEKELAFVSVFQWETAILFLGFVVITFLWEYSIAIMSFLSTMASGRRPLWIQRLKEEILALGVITLILIALQGPLSSICIPDSTGSYSTKNTGARRLLGGGASAVDCGKGKRQLFTATLIHDTHLLLFAVAVIHIIYTTGTLYLCLARMRAWKLWEVAARDGNFLDFGHSYVMRSLADSKLGHSLAMLWRGIWSLPTQQQYTLLRMTFAIRAEEHGLPLKRFNFLNILTHAMELQFVEAAENSWVLSAVMAIFLAIPRSAYPLYFLAGLSIVTTIFVTAKLHSVVVHLGAYTVMDYGHKLKAHVTQQRTGFSEMHKESFHDHAHEGDVDANAVLEKDSNALIKANGADKPKSNAVVPLPAPLKGVVSEFVSEFEHLRHRLHTSTSHAKRSLAGHTHHLFWGSSPALLMWLFQLSYIENSMNLTLILYGLARDGKDLLKVLNVGGLVALVVVDLLLLLHSAVVLLPLFAMALTVGSHTPKKILKEIERDKERGDKDEHTKGLGGKLLRVCFGAYMEAEDDDGEELKQHQEVFALLAGHAGVIGIDIDENTAARAGSNPLLVEFLKIWLAIAKEGRDSNNYNRTIVGDVKLYQDAFHAVDANKSGSISSLELAKVLRAMGTRATVEELRDMISEIDEDGTDEIDFREFMLFLLFKFCDADDDGYLDTKDLRERLVHTKVDTLGLGTPGHAAKSMVHVVEESAEDRRGRLELPEFMRFFSKGIGIQFSHQPSDAKPVAEAVSLTHPQQPGGMPDSRPGTSRSVALSGVSGALRQHGWVSDGGAEASTGGARGWEGGRVGGALAGGRTSQQGTLQHSQWCESGAPCAAGSSLAAELTPLEPLRSSPGLL